jgi:CTP:molybdopterin cytidylyltransferase MocA
VGRLVAIVLAAGGSRRLGRPKQLLAFHGESLVRRAARAALESGADETLVVVGAHAERVAQGVGDLAVRVVQNPDWEEGLASSIRAGVAAARQTTEPLDALLLCLADQPLVDSAVLAELIRAWKEGAATVACGHPDGPGVPALFSRPSDLEALASLEGDRGARGLLRTSDTGGLRVIPCAAAAIDIDSEEDWRQWLEGMEP